MGLRQRFTGVHWRIGLAVLVGAALASLPGLPAQADPPHPGVEPGLGWSAEWHYDTQTDPGFYDFGYSMNIPGVVLDGSGYDTDTTRGVTIALTDTSPEPGQCAWLTVTGNDEHYYWVACDGKIVVAFTDLTPSDLTFTLELRNAENTLHEASVMILPSSLNYPALHNSGIRGGWEYLTDDVVHYTLVRPGATVNGFASGWASRAVDMGITSNVCTVTTLYNPSAKGSKTACGGTLVSFGAATAIHDFKIVNCLALGRSIHCIPLYVM